MGLVDRVADLDRFWNFFFRWVNLVPHKLAAYFFLFFLDFFQWWKTWRLCGSHCGNNMGVDHSYLSHAYWPLLVICHYHWLLVSTYLTWYHALVCSYTSIQCVFIIIRFKIVYPVLVSACLQLYVQASLHFAIFGPYSRSRFRYLSQFFQTLQFPLA